MRNDADNSEAGEASSKFYTYGPGTFIFDDDIKPNETPNKIQKLVKNITDFGNDAKTHTVLTYGPSGAGKTYFIFGNEKKTKTASYF